MTFVLYFRSDLVIVRVEDIRSSQVHFREPTIFIASLAMNTIYVSHLRSGLSLSPNRLSMHGERTPVHSYRRKFRVRSVMVERHLWFTKHLMWTANVSFVELFELSQRRDQLPGSAHLEFGRFTRIPLFR